MIPGGGVLILGQGKDLSAGDFSSYQSFVGEMINAQLWNYVLSVREINRLSLSCQAGHGNILTWVDFLNGTFSGAVHLISASSCN